MAWLLAVAAVWLFTWRHLAVEWRFNDQYSYGYAVPWLAIFAGWRRLRRCTTAEPDDHPVPAAAPLYPILAAAWLVLLFAELLRRQDPTWRLVGWLMTFAASVLTAGWLYRWGGWKVLRPMLFAIGFAWLALPWPAPIENRLTLTLMHVVTSTVVELLNWTGIAAVQHGNVIELSRGLVGIDTACSGVQSFQASLMAAVFLGELYWLGPGQRLVLVVLGWSLASLGNLVRVCLLARSVDLEGTAGMQRYHDPVGYTITAVTFLGLWGMAAWVSRNQNVMNPHCPEPSSARKPILTGCDGYGMVSAVALIPLLAWLWFDLVPGGRTLSIQTTPRWSLAKTSLVPGWRATDLVFAPAERASLRFSEGEGLQMVGPAGETAQVLHFFWKPGAQVPSLAFSHTPDICMPSAGWEQVSPATPVTIRVHGATLPCLLYQFRSGRQQQAVLHTVWYGGQPQPLGDPFWTGAARGSRLAALWTGPFRRGHEVLTLFLPDAGSTEAQVRVGEEMLERVLAPAQSSRPH